MKKSFLLINIMLFSLCYAQKTLAQQVTSDGTLSTIVTPSNNNRTFTITGSTSA